MQGASKKFYSSLSLLLLLNGVIKPIWIFGIDRRVQNEVGTETYGIYFSLLSLSIVFSFLLDWGLTAFLNRQLAAGQKFYQENIGNLLLLKLFFAAAYILVVVITAAIAGISHWLLLWPVLLIQILTSLFIFLRSIVTARQNFSADAWLSVLDKTLMIILCGAFLFIPSLFGEINIGIFLWCQVICTAIAVLAVTLIVFKEKTNLSFSIKEFLNRKLLMAALPYATIVVLMSMHSRLDGFLLEQLHPNGAYEAGLYAGAYRLLDAANIAGYLLASFLLPYIAKLWSERKNTEAEAAVLQSRHLLMVFAAGLVCVVFVLAPVLQQKLYNIYDERAVDIMRFCMMSLIGYSLIQVYGTLLTATGHIISFCILTLLAVITNIILNLILIPRLGAMGCCIAAVVSQFSCGIALLVYAKEKLNINLHYRSLLIYIFTGALVATILDAGESVNINTWFLLFGAAVLVIITMFLTGLLNLKAIATTFLNKQNKTDPDA
jgi:O-antigen/teichoic acid export membrane protein